MHLQHVKVQHVAMDDRHEAKQAQASKQGSPPGAVAGPLELFSQGYSHSGTACRPGQAQAARKVWMSRGLHESGQHQQQQRQHVGHAVVTQRGKDHHECEFTTDTSEVEQLRA